MDMGKKRKRAPGGGRKPNPNKKVMFSTRLEPHVMAALKEAAASWPGGNVSAFTEYLIERGLRERSERERDPALRGLLFMIAQLAERVSGGQYTPDADVRSYFQQEWRTDLFKFRAFKFAIGKLLDALEEPPGEIRPAMTEEQAKDANKFFGTSPEFMKLMVEIYKSPESLGAHQFANLWTQVVKSDLPFTEAERKMMLKDPIFGRVMEREYYGFQRARKALELRPEAEVTMEFLSKVIDEDKFAELKRLKKEVEELEAKVKKIKAQSQ